MTTHSTIVRACRAAVLCIVCTALCGCSSTSLSDTGQQPIDTSSTALVEFEDFDAMSDALGFDMVQISGGGYIPQRYAVIDGEIGEIIYTHDESELNLRASAAARTDIAGVNGVLFQRTNMNGTEVLIGNYREIQVAQFEVGGRVYAMSATNMPMKSFEDIVEQIVAQLGAA